MSTNAIIVDGSTGGTNTNVVRVIPQTTLNSDSTINAEANKGYTLTSATLQTINLPTPCIPGDVFALHGKGNGLFKVVQRAGEQITLGNKSTTLGVSGFIDSTNSGDDIYLTCTDASGIWKNDGGYGGEFLINGVTATNTINNTVGGNDVVLTSPSNNVRIGGTAPNFTVDVGTSSSGLRTVVINNKVAGTHGNDVVAIGEAAAETGQGDEAIAIGLNSAKTDQGIRAISIGKNSAETNQGIDSISIGSGAANANQGTNAIAVGNCAAEISQGNNAIAIGWETGKDNQGSNAVAIAIRAGKINQGLNAIAIGAIAGENNQGIDSICIGFNCAPNSALANTVQIGAGCASAGAIGRLAFGSAMEAVTPIGSTAASQQGYINLEWNGAHVRIPALSPTSESSIVNEIGFVKMENNVWAGRVFGFTASYAELIPALATYFSNTTANFTYTTNGRLQYTGTPKKFTIEAAFETEAVFNYAAAIHINGIINADSETYAITDVGVDLTHTMTLNTNDIVSLYVKMDSAVSNRAVANFSLNITG